MSSIMDSAVGVVADLAAHKGKVVPHKHHDFVETVTGKGVKVLELVTIIMAVAFVVFVGAAANRKGGNKAHGFCSFFICAIAALSYFAMATQEGSIVIHVNGGLRQVFYARYIDWVFTTPLLLLDVLLLSGVTYGDLLWIVAADVLMIVTGLISALVHTGHWVWFWIGCVAMLAVFYGLLVPGRNGAFRRSNEVGQMYTGLVVMLAVLWTAYPIVFAFAEGTGRISSNMEVFLYGILDVIAKVVFGAIIIAKAPHQEGSGSSILETSINTSLLGHTDDGAAENLETL